MGWMQLDLRGLRVPVPHDSGGARARRIALREQLIGDPGLPGASAIAIADEIQILELREAADSLHELLYSRDTCNIPACGGRLRAA